MSRDVAYPQPPRLARDHTARRMHSSLQSCQGHVFADSVPLTTEPDCIQHDAPLYSPPCPPQLLPIASISSRRHAYHQIRTLETASSFCTAVIDDSLPNTSSASKHSSEELRLQAGRTLRSPAVLRGSICTGVRGAVLRELQAPLKVSHTHTHTHTHESPLHPEGFPAPSGSTTGLELKRSGLGPRGSAPGAGVHPGASWHSHGVLAHHPTLSSSIRKPRAGPLVNAMCCCRQGLRMPLFKADSAREAETDLASFPGLLPLLLFASLDKHEVGMLRCS